MIRINKICCTAFYFKTRRPVVNAEIWNRGKGKNWRLGRRLCPLSPKFFQNISCKNNAFLCRILTCFKMHPVNRERAVAPPLARPLGSVTADDRAAERVANDY